MTTQQLTKLKEHSAKLKELSDDMFSNSGNYHVISELEIVKHISKITKFIDGITL